MLIYLISGRSFFSDNLGRKISEVCNIFKSITDTIVITGGDISNKGEKISKEKQLTNNPADYHKRWYVKYPFLDFIVKSVSELKDVYHCFISYKYIKGYSKDVDIIWERSSRLHFAGVFMARKLNIPSVLEWKDHLVDYKYSLLHPLALYIERWKNKNASYITVESEVLKKELINNGVDGSKIYVTYNAVNPDEFKKNPTDSLEVRRELGLEKDDIVVGYVGSYAFYHDSIRMVKAAKLLRDRGITNIKWLLIGDGKDKLICEKYAKENGLLDDKTVIMLPFQPKERIPRFLSAMDVTILPGSTDIICPIKVMEYMAAKSVVLVPDYECNREIINENNGLLFEPGNEESIVNSLIKISNDRNSCKKLGEAARKTVVEKLTWDKTYGAVLVDILCKLHI